MGANSSAWKPIEEMGVYKAYMKMTKAPAIKWMGVPMNADERAVQTRKERLLNKPINKMGVYLALQHYGRKHAVEQQEMREMRAMGMTIERIALEMETSEKVIRCRLAGGWKV